MYERLLTFSGKVAILTVMKMRLLELTVKKNGIMKIINRLEELPKGHYRYCLTIND